MKKSFITSGQDFCSVFKSHSLLIIYGKNSQIKPAKPISDDIQMLLNLIVPLQRRPRSVIAVGVLVAKEIKRISPRRGHMRVSAFEVLEQQVLCK